MTFEEYAKAAELNDRMSYLIEVQGLLDNACKDRFLATIGQYEFEDARCICITKCKVINHISLDDDIREKLTKVIRDEYNKVLEEFKAL